MVAPVSWAGGRLSPGRPPPLERSLSMRAGSWSPRQHRPLRRLGRV